MVLVASAAPGLVIFTPPLALAPGAFCEVTMTARPFPLPDDIGIKRARAATYLYRAAASHVRSFETKQEPARSAQEMFGKDEVTALVLRGATTQATLGSPTWAGNLAQTVIEDAISEITSTSAAAGLIARGMKLDFAGAAQLKVPGHLVDATDAGGFVAEEQAVRVRNQRYNSGITLTPRKMMVIMAVSSNLEVISRSLLTEASALLLDKIMFGTQTDDGVTPSGILHNATTFTGTAGGGTAALAGDIKALMGALVDLGAGRDPVFIANPQQAATLKLVASPQFDYPVLQSSAIPKGTLIVVEAASFVSAFNATPQFQADQHMAIHMEDTSPTDITGGTPSPAVPVKSLFQTDSIGLRMILRCSWSMRAATTDANKAAVAYVTGATW